MAARSDTPVWFDPLAPLGAAVRYLASLSPKFQGIRIQLYKGGKRVDGPSIGQLPTGRKTEFSEIRASITRPQTNRKKPKQKHRAELIALSRRPGAFGPLEESLVRGIAQELGELWPA